MTPMSKGIPLCTLCINCGVTSFISTCSLELTVARMSRMTPGRPVVALDSRLSTPLEHFPSSIPPSAHLAPAFVRCGRPGSII